MLPPSRACSLARPRALLLKQRRSSSNLEAELQRVLARVQVLELAAVQYARARELQVPVF